MIGHPMAFRQKPGGRFLFPGKGKADRGSRRGKGGLHPAALLLVLLLFVSPGGCAPAGEVTEEVRVETDGRDRVFEGWGTSLCWWANRIGYSDILSEKAADAFFGPGGLSLNIMRYNIGGGDDPGHHHITRTDSAVPGWLRRDEGSGETVFDPAADRDQLNVLVRCCAEAGEEALVEVFSNSPPYFMTVSGCSSGNAYAGRDNLSPGAEEEFADYLCRVTAYLRREMHVPVVSLSPMNEPATAYWGAYSPKQEGCHFDMGESQSRLLTACAEKMREYGLEGVLLAASDETDTGMQLEEYMRYSPEARAAVGRINTHTYGTSRSGALGEKCLDDGMALWMSETDGGNTAGKGMGEMGAALWLAEKIVSDFASLRPSAWVLWQVIDSHISSAGVGGLRDSGMVDVKGGYWGTAVADHDRQELLLTQKYYAFGQFTRYIRPGMRVFACGGMLCALGEDRTVVVAVNSQSRDRRVHLDLSRTGTGSGTVRVIRTSGSMADGEHWDEKPSLVCEGGGFDAFLKAGSVTTFIIGRER